MPRAVDCANGAGCGSIDSRRAARHTGRVDFLISVDTAAYAAQILAMLLVASMFDPWAKGAAVGETVILYPSEKERRAAGSPTGRNTPERQKRASAATKKTPAKECAPAADESERLCRTDLLGRTVRRSVFDDFGRPIAKAGEKVTAEMIGRARRSNRLLTLSMNTLTNFDILT